MQTPESAPSLAGLARAVLRHKAAAALCFLGVVAVAAAITALSPRAYCSQAKLFLRLGRENATLDSTATLGQTPVVAMPPSREGEVYSVMEMLRGRGLLEKVVDRVGPRAIL